MIRFVHDYTTRALPPEVFKKEDEVSRSKESELYFVQMGVAGFVVDGTLVDQDYQPIVATATLVEIVSPGDRRFARGGRGGEMIGLDAPQRASTGPGNAALRSTTSLALPSGGAAAPADLRHVTVDQLTSDLATSVQQLDDHREETSKQIAELTDDLTAAQRAREAALADLAAAQSEKASLASERDAARAEKMSLKTDLDAARADAETKAARVAELEAAAASTATAKDK